MGNRLTAETLLEIEDRLMNKKEPILKIAREVGVTRNAIKRNFLLHLKNQKPLNVKGLGQIKGRNPKLIRFGDGLLNTRKGLSPTFMIFLGFYTAKISL